MTPETVLLIVTLFATFVGTAIGTAITTVRTNRRLATQSQTMQVIRADTQDVDKRVGQLEADKQMLEEARDARDRRISVLEGELKQTNDHVSSLELSVKGLTDEKAGLVIERDGLKLQLSRAEDEIRSLNIRVITLEAQLNAEKSVGERVVQPIAEALARLAAPTIAKVVESPAPTTPTGEVAA